MTPHCANCSGTPSRKENILLLPLLTAGRLARFRPSVVDLVITDLNMPEEDGLMVIMKIREVKPATRVIAISGGGRAGPGSYLLMASKLGADHIMSKPFLPSELVQKVKELLG